MKKFLGTALILLSTLFIGYSQQDNNSSDDVYYDDDNSVPASQPADQQNYDDDNSDAGAPTYQTFYDQLTPYGNWINYPGYGYCWVPNNVDPDFAPYTTNGSWVYTDMGWTWVSDFAWGWGPFHYGRWFEDPTYGWMWVPGYDWAPAWVVWGDYGGYYGWACLGPHDILSPHFRPRADQWHFCEHQYMGRHDVGQHVVHTDVVAHNVDINTHISIIGHANTYHQSVFFSGPKPAEVERFSGQKIQAVKINNVREPEQTKVNNNAVNIYRPNIVRNNTQHNATPAKVNNVQNTQPIRPNNERPQNTNVQPRNVPATPERQQQPVQQWIPPRQNTQQVQPRQNNTPSQPQRTFVPSERPAQQPAQHYSPPPQQQQHFNAPAQHFNAPAAPRGGGGRR